ncbi:hypothetical protein N1031_13440 [Herbiconiux moechotypicola]|uniref:hypothetical protein n=1 Tax=Herbiconiux moechotypicola TaxID=637393 RepID=UPI00217E7451|nr:hypothetical protein [Herbiconiux moechotypicola]MCS5730767.1 hypothetical protein [Herbiconiux moechotypicola]
MTTVLWPEAPVRELPKKLAGALFVLFWAAALALWIIAPNIVDPRLGAFLIDTGIVLASVGFAGTQMSSLKAFRNALIASVVAIALFALGDFGEILALSYFLRVFVPFIALLSSIYAVVGRVKVWYN